MSESLFEKGVAIKNKASSHLLPNAVNHIVLVGSSLAALLATLSDPGTHNIFLYRILLCSLLLSIVSGVLCSAIVTIDYYILGKKVLKEAAKARPGGGPKLKELRTGRLFFLLTLSTFSACLLFFLTSVVLLVIYAW